MKGLNAFWVAILIVLFGFGSLRTQSQPVDAAAKINSVAPNVQPLQAAGVENFYQLSRRIYSGSAPEGEAAFAALKERGIKTIITVDGAKPDVETARRYGIRYVHLPFGYDGVPTNQAVRLVKAAETLPGPIYVHCHHGLHRGPAGAAVICMATEGWTPQQAEAWLRLAGTATNYAGLYKSVQQFRPPSAETLRYVPKDFPEKSEVSPLAETMIEIDQRFDHLKLVRKAGYRQPPSNPDLDPAHEALLLNELFRELLRSPTVQKRGPDFQARLTEAQEASDVLRQLLSSPPVVGQRADAACQRISDACAACHKAFRN